MKIFHSLDAMIQQKIKRNLNESKHIESLKTTFFNVTQPEEVLFNEFQGVYNQLQNNLNSLSSGKVFLLLSMRLTCRTTSTIWRLTFYIQNSKGLIL